MQKPERSAALFVASLLAMPACAAPVIKAAPGPVARAPVWTAAPIREPPRDAACVRPLDKRMVSFTLGPRPTLVDAVAWASSIVCEPFVLPGPLVAENRRLLMIGPDQIRMEDAYRFFLDALESAELVVGRQGNVWRVIAMGDLPRGGEMPGADADGPSPESYVTILLHLEDLSPEKRAQVLADHRDSGICHGNIRPIDQDTIIITDVRWKIERLLGRPIGRGDPSP